jgi:hypothetical protein
MKHLAALLSCVCLSASATLAHAGVSSTVGVGQMPLAFEPNQGQTDSRVDFLARGLGYTLFLSSESATFALLHGAADAAGDGQRSVIRMNVSGANQHAKMQPADLLPGTVNYLRDRNAGASLTGLPTYARTRVPQIYRGIDLTYYGTNGHLEYDFVVSPRANPYVIRLSFNGATPEVERNGDLLLRQRGTDDQHAVRLQKPVLYQAVDGERRPVEGRFKLAANHLVSFQVGAYDHTRALTIDPVVAYASYLGGSTQNSQPSGMALNAAGEIYLTGITFAVDYPTTTGVISPTCPAPMTGQKKCGTSSESSAFVSKIAANGQSLIYSTYLGGAGAGPGEGGSAQSAGGSGADFGVAIAVDANDEAWVLGGTNSNNFPITADAYETYCSPVYNNSTAAEYSGCAAFNGGAEYIYGATSMFVVKLNPTGTNILYGTFLGGSQGETPAAIALDQAGNVYVAGSAITAQNGPPAEFGQYNYPTTSTAYQTTATANSVTSAIVSELSANGHTMLYSTFLSAPIYNTFGQALAVSNGKIFLGGSTQDPNLPTTAGALSRTCTTNTAAHPQCELNGYLAEFDPSKTGAASLVFATYLNGTHASTSGIPADTSNVTALAADSAGNVYATGSNQYINFPSTAGSAQPTCNTHGNNDQCQTGFVTKMSATGALRWSTFYGSPSGATGAFTISAIALDSANNVYIAANTNGAGDFVTKGSLAPWSGGSMVLAELSADGSQVLFGTFYGGPSGNAVNPTAVALDASGNIVFAGYTAAADLPLVRPLQSTSAAGFNQGFFANISTEKLASAATAAVTPASAIAGATVRLTATITGQSGQPRPTGSVTFSNGTAALGSATLANTGVATLSSTTLTVGTYAVVATYAGDAVYAASTSAAATLTISTPAAPTVTIAASPASVTSGQTSTLTWSSTNATACTASGAWTGSQATGGTAHETPTATGVSTYTLSCTGAGGSANASATVTVAAAPVTPPPSSGGHSGGGAVDWLSISSLLSLSVFGAWRRRAK